jgi:hypothetical protein
MRQCELVKNSSLVQALCAVHEPGQWGCVTASSSVAPCCGNLPCTVLRQLAVYSGSKCHLQSCDCKWRGPLWSLHEQCHQSRSARVGGLPACQAWHAPSGTIRQLLVTPAAAQGIGCTRAFDHHNVTEPARMLSIRCIECHRPRAPPAAAHMRHHHVTN